MRTNVVWQDRLPVAASEQTTGVPVVWDLAFRPDGTLMVIAAGKRLIVYNSADGAQVKSRPGACAARRAAARLPFLSSPALTPPPFLHPLSSSPPRHGQRTRRTSSRSPPRATARTLPRAARTRR